MMEFLHVFWRTLGTPQGKLLFGFVLTTAVGGALTYLFQVLSWRRQVHLDLFRQRLTDGTQLLEQLTSLVDRRYFWLQRLIWAIGDNEEAQNISKKEEAYFAIVIEWNEKLRSFHNRLRLLVDDTVALQFLDYSDDYRQDAPESLHYRFVKAHRAVLTAKKDHALAVAARQEVDQLNWGVSRFAYDITTLFMARASSLELLHSDKRSSSRPGAGQVSGPPWTGRAATSR